MSTYDILCNPNNVFLFRNKEESTATNAYAIPNLNPGRRIKKLVCSHASMYILYEDNRIFRSQTTASDTRLVESKLGRKIVDVGCSNKMYALLTDKNMVLIKGKQENRTVEMEWDLKKELPGYRLKQIDGGGEHITFLLENESRQSKMYFHGLNDLGSTGFSVAKSHEKVVPCNLNITKTIDMIACGNCHTLFLCQGEVYGCGYDQLGQLGAPPRGGYYSTVKIDVPGAVRYIACGSYFSVFITEDNCVYCCGTNFQKILGVGSDEREIHRIVRVSQFDNRVSKVFVGDKHWYILTTDDELYYSGETYNAPWPKSHIATRYSNGEFVKCLVPLHTVHHIDIACGSEFSVVRFTVPKKEMFNSAFVRSMCDANAKSSKFSDVSFK